jgi:adenylate kinase
MRTVITISGTPGTGKTCVAKELAKLLGANVISVSKLVKERKITGAYDKKRKAVIVDLETLRKIIKKNLKQGISIIDGHMSHLVPADFVIILRCDPRVLRKRLSTRGYNRGKICENIDAELTDVITAEALAYRSKGKSVKNRVVEIDTTRQKPKATAVLILHLFQNNMQRGKYTPGKINWLEEYAKEIKRSIRR